MLGRELGLGYLKSSFILEQKWGLGHFHSVMVRVRNVIECLH